MHRFCGRYCGCSARANYSGRRRCSGISWLRRGVRAAEDQPQVTHVACSPARCSARPRVAEHRCEGHENAAADDAEDGGQDDLGAKVEDRRRRARHDRRCGLCSGAGCCSGRGAGRRVRRCRRQRGSHRRQGHVEAEAAADGAAGIAEADRVGAKGGTRDSPGGRG